jgi:hypothetical protein
MFRTRAFDPISFAMTGFGILLVTGLPSFSEALPDLRWVGVQNTQHRLPQTLIIPDTATPAGHCGARSAAHSVVAWSSEHSTHGAYTERHPFSR